MRHTLLAALITGGAAVLCTIAPAPLDAQIRASELQTISQVVDGTTITLSYSRPRLRGRDVVFGTRAVRWGEVWTPGANWATTLEVDRPVRVSGVDVPAGEYSVWMIVSQDSIWTMLLDPRVRLFHEDHPTPDSTHIRIPVRADSAADAKEDVLTWSFPNITSRGGGMAMHWDRVRVTMDFTVEPTLSEFFPEQDAQRYIGRYVMVPPPGAPPMPDSMPAPAVVVTYERGGLKGRIEPPDNYLQTFALMPVGPQIFTVGLYMAAEVYADGEIYEVLRPDFMITFAEVDGVMTLEARGPDDELYFEGRRVAPRPLLDSLLQREVEERQFSGVVMMANAGVPIYQASVGQATDAAVIVQNTRFRLASITKAFTAVLAMQLVEQGRLTLASPVAELVPELMLDRRLKILVEDLLLHRSGLPGEPEAMYGASRDALTMVNETLVSEPYKAYGKFNYSNLDYLVLGLIIERVTGKNFGTVLQEQILTPLGMNDSGLATRTSTGIAQGYVADSSGKILREPSIHIENFAAAGAMYGTVADLLKFDQALYTDALLKPESIAAMYTSHPELGYVAFGSWVYDYYFLPNAPRVVERRGGILGFNHAFIRLPELRKTLIILSNNDRFDPDTFGKLDSFKDKLIKALVESQ